MRLVPRNVLDDSGLLLLQSRNGQAIGHIVDDGVVERRFAERIESERPALGRIDVVLANELS